ncbi:hypothetical protein CUMW_282550 [Citrus unshiu]|uniref:Uncharacterized protein n=1 Tax=Citrus unshiu TaxID=55188 RepID=A0A2H5N2B6_CITUN|nr:hypothetical protein CUMW_282550 [Citrus unshiu]
MSLDSDSDSLTPTPTAGGENGQRQRQQGRRRGDPQKTMVPVRYGEAPPPEMKHARKINVGGPVQQQAVKNSKDTKTLLELRRGFRKEDCGGRKPKVYNGAHGFISRKDPENWMEQDLKELWADARWR